MIPHVAINITKRKYKHFYLCLGKKDHPWRREWLTTPRFLPGKFHGQWSLVGYSPRGHKRVGHDSEIRHTHVHTGHDLATE